MGLREHDETLRRLDTTLGELKKPRCRNEETRFQEKL
jgi:hypothetical protein